MKKVLLSLLIITALTTPLTARAENGPPPTNKTSAEANCSWGSTPSTPTTLKSYDTVYASPSDWSTAHPAPGDCNIGVIFMSGNRGMGKTSLTAYSDNNGSPERKSAVCANGDDPACDASKWFIMWNQSTFYKCQNAGDMNCVHEFSATDPNGNKATLTYVKSFPDDAVRPGYNGTIVKYPAGGNPSIWSLSTSSGEVKLMVNGWYDMAWESNGGKWEVRPGNMFQLFIVPILETPLPSDLRGINCFAQDKTTCIKLQPTLPKDYVFKVSLNLSDNATMFLNGRLDKPVVYTEPISGGHRFTIEAAPSPALSVAQWVPRSSIPKKVFDDAFKGVGGTWFNDSLMWSNAEYKLEGQEGSVSFLNAMLPYIQDKVSFVQYIWSATNNPTSDRYNQNCQNEARGQVLGVVSTNATAYRGDPPTYNKSTASLDYEVAAPHYMPDGSDSIGRYSINMNAKFLLCILGVAKVPATATIGLTYANGQASISTLAVKQDKDWLRVQLDNFHFSAPKISVKFVQESPSKTTAPATKTSNKTVTCVKGKTSKKISGVNPKCPAGFVVKK